MAEFAHRHLLGIDGLSADDVRYLLDQADRWVAFNREVGRQDHRLAGLIQINAFFENSTRTLFSFEIAGKRLGALVANFHVAGSSIHKGETLIDTAQTLNAMRPDILVIRHHENGAPNDVAAVMECPVVNGGDGQGEHPTQALLDALTMRRHFGRIDGLKVVICGDIRHSRVAGSNLRALPLLGAEVRIAGPEALLPERVPEGVTAFADFDEALEGADVAMMLRIQRERMESDVGSALSDYHARYGLTRERLARAAPGAVAMHPGPMNRGVEIDADVADDPERSLILQQVELGVAVRMAVLDILTRDRRRAP